MDPPSQSSSSSPSPTTPSPTPSPSSSPSGLVTLPLELSNRVAASLPTVSFGALRLTCKALEKALFNYFSSHFFSKKQFMLTEESLQALIDISEHPTLAPCLKHLIIGLDHYERLNPERPVRLWRSDFSDDKEFVRYKRASEAQYRLFTTGRAASLLSKALDNLPNLRTLEIRDFNSRTRYRDAAEGSPAWTSYGSTTIAKTRPYALRLSPSFPITGLAVVPRQFTEIDLVEAAFQTVMAALMSSSCHPPEQLLVTLKDRKWGLQDRVFDLGPQDPPRLTAMLTTLRVLHLDLSLTPPARPRASLFHDDEETNSSISDPANTCIRRFLSSTPNLEWLRLNFHHPDSTGTISLGLINWLATVPSGGSALARPASGQPPKDWPFEHDEAPPSWDYETNPAPVALNLKRLDIGSAVATPYILKKLLDKFTRLDTISLVKVCLAPDSNPDPGPEAYNGLWPQVLNHIRMNGRVSSHVDCLNLQTVQFTTWENLKAFKFSTSYLTGASYVSESVTDISHNPEQLSRLMEMFEDLELKEASSHLDS